MVVVLSTRDSGKPKSPDDIISKIEEDRRKLEEMFSSLIKKIEEETKKLKASTQGT